MHQQTPTYKFTSLCLLLLFINSLCIAQIITVEPTFPTASDAVTITFNAKEGNQGLMGYEGEVYAHTGVITDKSAGSSDWKYVKTNWGENTGDTQLEKIGEDLYQLKIQPDIQTYYGVPEGEVIKQLAFVFRSGAPIFNVYKEGKTEDGADIFYDVTTTATLSTVKLIRPDKKLTILKTGENLLIEGQGNNVSNLVLKIDGEIVAETNTTAIEYTFQADVVGTYSISLEGKSENGTFSDERSIFVHPEEPETATLPSNFKTGINYIDQETVGLVLHAPDKEYVIALGDFSDWLPDMNYFMKRTPDGNYYWTELTNLIPKQEYIYQYYIDGELLIADPYANKIVDPNSDGEIEEVTYPNLIPYPKGKTTGIASVLQTAQDTYDWQYDDFERPHKGDLVIYELLIRDFTEEHSFQSIIDTLNYLERLGINAIELMPVMEFENNDSWGYNPSFMFAVDKYYGTATDLKRLIDECHRRNIAVILDIVLNHAFGQSPMVQMYWDAANNQPSSNNPWFNPIAKHDFNVGYDFNHEQAATKNYTKDVVQYWIEEFHIDGYRFDLSKGFTQKNTLGDVGAWGRFDQSRIDIWKEIKGYIGEIDPNCYLILEHFADNGEERALSKEGFMLWGNMNYNFNEATMGYNTQGKSNFSGAYYGNRGFEEPNLVAYMESHDEERLMYKNLQYGAEVENGYSVKDKVTALQRIELAAAFYFMIPGPKMIWQFGELGYDYSIDHNGRLGRKPIRWDYYDDLNRRDLYQTFSDLARLKKSDPIFRGDYDSVSLDFNEGGKVMYLWSQDLNVVVIGNFNVFETRVEVDFPRTGTWYDYLSDDEVFLAEFNPIGFYMPPGTFKVYINKTKSEALGLEDNQDILSNPEILLYPNPTEDYCNVILPEQMFNNGENQSLILYNIYGQKILEQAIEIKQTTIRLDLQNLGSGLYFVELTKEGTKWFVGAIVR